MKLLSKNKVTLWFAGAVVAVLAFASPAKAVNPQNLDIRVSINATKSLAASPTFYDFGALAVDTASNSATAIVVTNDSGALQESYRMTGANASSLGGGTSWDISASTGALDDYRLDAQFSDARPALAETNWANDTLSLSVSSCTATVLGNGTAGESGQNVSPAGGSNTRNLWFRMVTPAIVSDTTQRQATIILGVQ